MTAPRANCLLTSLRANRWPSRRVALRCWSLSARRSSLAGCWWWWWWLAECWLPQAVKSAGRQAGWLAGWLVFELSKAQRSSSTDVATLLGLACKFKSLQKREWKRVDGRKKKPIKLRLSSFASASVQPAPVPSGGPSRLFFKRPSNLGL